MRNKTDFRALRWLYEEIPSLIEAKVISPETAEGIRLYYGKIPVPQKMNWLQVIFAIFGTVLIAGGISLIVAHNWDDFPRNVRAALSFLPLVAAMLISTFALLKKKDSAGWMESASLFHSLMIGVCISLISQTYHINGSAKDFLLTWTLLQLPLIYIHRSSLSAILGVALVVSWMISSTNFTGRIQAPWLWLKFVGLYAAILPHWILEWRKNILGWQNIATGWSYCLGLQLAVAFILPSYRSDASIIPLVYGAVLAFMYAADKFFFRVPANPFSRPLYLVGAGGTLIHVFASSFKHPSSFYPLSIFDNACWIPIMITLAAVALSVAAHRSRQSINLFAAAFPIALFFTQTIGHKNPQPASIVMNLYGLVLGIACILRGLDTRRWSVMNAGIILGAAVILIRFFSDEFSFIVRGAVFIALGIAFLFANYLLWRKVRKEAA